VNFPVIDGHADTIERFLADPSGFFRPGGVGHLDSARLRQTGQNVQVMAVYTPPTRTGEEASRHAMDFICAYKSLLGSPENQSLVPPWAGILTAADLLAACRPDSFGFLLFLEGASPLRGRIRNLDSFHRLGVRGITLTHNHDNEAGRGCMAEGKGKGLTDFGRDLVRAMEERHMAVDVAHANEELFWDVAAIAQRPLIDSHTGLRRFWNHPRNLDDTQLAAVARTGGVACIDFVPDHLEDRAGQARPVTLAQVVRVIRAAVDVAGIDAVGLGSDWDGFGETVEGLEDCAALPRLAEAMAAEGFTGGEIAKVFGGNLLRALGEILA